MKQLSSSKNCQFYSLKGSRYIPNLSNPKKATQSRPIFLRYINKDDKSNNLDEQNQQLNTQNSQNLVKTNLKIANQQHYTSSLQIPETSPPKDQKLIARLRQNQAKKQNNSQRKNATPQKISSIYDYINVVSHQNISLNKAKFPKKQYQTNKKLIEKLLSVRYTVKVVSHKLLPQNSSQFQLQNSKSNEEGKIKRGNSQKMESKQERANLNRIVQSLKSQLAVANLQENQFKEILKKKIIQDLQNSRPYSNRQIYTKVRKEYKREIQQGNNGPKELESYSCHKKVLLSQNIKLRYDDNQLKKKYPIVQKMLERRKKMISQHQLRYREPAVEGW